MILKCPPDGPLSGCQFVVEVMIEKVPVTIHVGGKAARHENAAEHV
jgi:hypothetical protein